MSCAMHLKNVLKNVDGGINRSRAFHIDPAEIPSLCGLLDDPRDTPALGDP